MRNVKKNQCEQIRTRILSWFIICDDDIMIANYFYSEEFRLG